MNRDQDTTAAQADALGSPIFPTIQHLPPEFTGAQAEASRAELPRLEAVCVAAEKEVAETAASLHALEAERVTILTGGGLNIDRAAERLSVISGRRELLERRQTEAMLHRQTALAELLLCIRMARAAVAEDFITLMNDGREAITALKNAAAGVKLPLLDSLSSKKWASDMNTSVPSIGLEYLKGFEQSAGPIRQQIEDLLRMAKRLTAEIEAFNQNSNPTSAS